MSYKVEEIEGIGPAYGEKLGAAGIETTDDLLDKCASRKGRSDTAEATGLSETLLLKWVNMADLMRISGVGGEYAELLEAAGVDTVKELRNRNAANLHEAMQKKNDEKKLTRQVPSEASIAKWIDQAKAMDPKVTY